MHSDIPAIPSSAEDASRIAVERILWCCDSASRGRVLLFRCVGRRVHMYGSQKLAFPEDGVEDPMLREPFFSTDKIAEVAKTPRLPQTLITCIQEYLLRALPIHRAADTYVSTQRALTFADISQNYEGRKIASFRYKAAFLSSYVCADSGLELVSAVFEIAHRICVVIGGTYAFSFSPRARVVHTTAAYADIEKVGTNRSEGRTDDFGFCPDPWSNLSGESDGESDGSEIEISLASKSTGASAALESADPPYASTDPPHMQTMQFAEDVDGRRYYIRHRSNKTYRINDSPFSPQMHLPECLYAERGSFEMRTLVVHHMMGQAA